MSWARIDDGYLDHPKVALLSPRAIVAHLRWILWCNRHLTDGLIPKAMVPKRDARDLHEAGLFDDAGDHWQVHDYLDYSPSRAEVEAKREAARKRMKRARGSRGGGSSGSGDVRANFTRGSPNPLPSPPLPDQPTRGGLKTSQPGGDPKPDAGPTPHGLKTAQKFQNTFCGPPPDDPPLDENTRLLARSLALSAFSEWEALRDHAKSKALVSADWGAELRSWMRRSGRFAEESRQRQAARSPPGRREHDRQRGEGGYTVDQLFKKTGEKARC